MSSRFASAWSADFEAFLAFKRALGYRYRQAEFTLRELDRSLVDQGRRRNGYRLYETILTWLGRRPGRKPVSVSKELSIIRQFYSFLNRQGYRGLPDPSWPQLPNTSTYVPYVFSVEEVRKILHLTRRLRVPFRRSLYRTLLRLRDVDLRAGTLFIRQSKGRSRWVPCHRSLCRELKRYLVVRKNFAPAGPDDYFFVATGRNRPPAMLSVKTASDNVRRLLQVAGIKPLAGRAGPRPYDMRHAFAVHRLTRWYRAGADLHARLPWLSAYMGHDDLLGTETYLTATPELLQLAGDRFRRRYESARRPN